MTTDVSGESGLRGHLLAILSGVAMLVVGVSLLFSVIGLRAGMADFSTVVTGLISSAYFAGYVLGVFVCPVLVSRVGACPGLRRNGKPRLNHADPARAVD